MRTKIYFLQDPDGNIRYIGKTTRPLSLRLSQHISHAKAERGGHRNNWIRLLLRSQKEPIIRLVGEVEGDGNQEEIAWINWFKEESFDLTNQSDGGEGQVGFKQSHESLLKKRESMLAHYRTHKYPREAVEKMRQSNIGRRHSLLARKNMSLAHKGKKLSPEHIANAARARIKPKVLCICQHCKVPFLVIPHDASTRKFCSQKCGLQSMVKPIIRKSCEYCGRAFYASTAVDRGGKRLTCSKLCAKKLMWQKRKNKTNILGKGRQ